MASLRCDHDGGASEDVLQDRAGTIGPGPLGMATPFPPSIRAEWLPWAEREAASHIEFQLKLSANYLRDFEAALNLFDYAARRVRDLEKRRDALKARMDAAFLMDKVSLAKRQRINRERQRTGRELMRFGSWQVIAARDGAMTIYHFFMNLNGINEQLRLECPELLSVIPQHRFKTISRLRKKYFKEFEKLRHAIGHRGELQSSLKEFIRNSLDGFLFLPSLLEGRTFSMTIEGRAVSYDISDETLSRLREIQADLFAAFNEAGRILEEKHYLAQLRLRENLRK